MPKDVVESIIRLISEAFRLDSRSQGYVICFWYDAIAGQIRASVWADENELEARFVRPVEYCQ